MSVSPKNHPNIPSHGDLPSPKIRSRAFIICGLEILILTVTVIGFFAMYESSPEHYRNKKISSNKELNKTIFRNWSSEVNSSAERSKRGEAGSFTDLKMRHGFYVRSIAISTAAFAIGFFVVGLSIHGILKDKAKFMVPHMIAQVSGHFWVILGSPWVIYGVIYSFIYGWRAQGLLWEAQGYLWGVPQSM